MAQQQLSVSRPTKSSENSTSHLVFKPVVSTEARKHHSLPTCTPVVHPLRAAFLKSLGMVCCFIAIERLFKGHFMDFRLVGWCGNKVGHCPSRRGAAWSCQSSLKVRSDAEQSPIHFRKGLMRNRNNLGQSVHELDAIDRCSPCPSMFISDRQLLIIPIRATTRASVVSCACICLAKGLRLTSSSQTSIKWSPSLTPFSLR